MPAEVVPKTAAILPAYKQPGLQAEAIVSALRQTEPTYLVVVIDGCPMPETRDVAVTFAVANPDRVFVVHRRNGGLSAARNTGIDFVLANWPQVEAVMFLDADNRMSARFMERALSALRAAPETVGWVYPDIDMVGPDECSSMRGEFSFLALLDWNYCDAGSVVRRALLESGLRFDEGLKSGFEDWDFWLQSAQAGFRGRHLANAGFGYRRRGESMISAAARRREIVMDEMNRKRRALLRPRPLFELETREAPRFAIVTPDAPTARFTSDPALDGDAVALPEMARRLRAFVAAPGASHFPPVVCFASPEALAALQEALLLHGVFWWAQVRLRESDGVRLFLRREPGVEARLTHAPEGSQAEGGPVLIFRRWSSAAKAASQIATVDFELRLPPSFSAAAEESAVAALTTFLAHERACPPAIPADWRTDIRPQRNDLLAIYERLCGCGAVAPIVRPASSRGEIGFVIPIHSFGGVEKVVANQARVLRGLGFRTHLFVTSGESFLLTDETRESFTSVNLLMHPQFDRSSDVAHYFGAPISGFERREDATFRLDALGLLSGMDVVVDTHSLGAHSLAARLREWGVRTFTALHLVDRNSQGAPVGNPHIALAYEHAYDGVLVISQDLRAWCLAHGIPDEKIVLVRNAPSYVSTEPVETIRARRAARPAGPLRVLFLGRLDAQKGLDSLTDILTATRGASFAWRVVGKAVLASPDAPAFDPGVAVEPPVHDPASLDALYDGADVLVLPSRFEGAPLTILEARRRGVVVIANDVGAVSEVIGAGGYLVDASMGPQGVVAGFVRTLRALARDEELLHERVRLTLDEPPPTWEETMGEFIERLGSDREGAQAVRVLSMEADSMRTP